MPAGFIENNRTGPNTLFDASVVATDATATKPDGPPSWYRMCVLACVVEVIVVSSSTVEPATGVYSNDAVAPDGSCTVDTPRDPSNVIVVAACTPSERAGPVTVI